MNVQFMVNGRAASIDVPPNTLLVQALREQLRLTGTHVGCDTSQCGACTVLVNGKAVKSCTMLAVQADGRVEQAVATYGRIDAAFNAAGIDGDAGRLTADCTLENWNRVIAVDLTGVWYCMRHQIPQMLKQGGGAIVNCASTAGLRGAAYCGVYSAAKHGVVGLTKAAGL